MNAIDIQKINKSFSAKPVLKNVSLTIKQGEIFGLLGPSGAGKTTLIKIILGQSQPDQGITQVLGKDSRKLSREDYTHFGMVLDQSGLYERLRVYDNLKLYASFYQLKEQDIDEALRQVELLADKKKVVAQLSKGMKQRLILARAIMHHPDILILDEPTSGLDPATTLKIHELLLELRAQGTTLFLTTHNMEEASSLCDRVALLHEGTILECDTPRAICERYDHINKITVVNKAGECYELDHTKESAAKLYDWMIQDQIRSIHSSEPTLGNVFITLTGKELV